MPALEDLRSRLAELDDLQSLRFLVEWDQQTMMPSAGGPARAHQLATLERIAHELSSAPEIGAWLDELESGAALEGVDADVVRIARRDFTRRAAVPSELAVELAHAAAAGNDAWQKAREADDFSAFAPALERNVALAREYAACFPDAAHPYDALLADFDFGLTGERVAEVLGPLADGLAPLIAEAARKPAPPELELSVEVQQQAVRAGLARVGVDEDSWRVDVSSHPFSTAIGPRDSRITTRYADLSTESIAAAMHEFGHSLYERQIADELRRTNLATGTSMSIHESQSKLWENHVARHPAFSAVLASTIDVDPGALHAAMTVVRPSAIRVSADEVTYPLHILLRFELERDLIAGTLAVADLPAAWNDAMKRLLGVEVASDAEGVLQDIHWSEGAFGYFPSYALGCMIAAQLWDALESEIGDQSDALGRGDVAGVRDWLGEKVHRFGRRMDTEPLVESATGRPLESAPLLEHLATVI